MFQSNNFCFYSLLFLVCVNPIKCRWKIYFWLAKYFQWILWGLWILQQPTNVTSFGRSFNLLHSAFIKTLQLSSYNSFSSKQYNYPVKISFHLILTSFPAQLTNCAKCLTLHSSYLNFCKLIELAKQYTTTGWTINKL